MIFILITYENTELIFDNLVWSDEFDGTGAIDESKWFHQAQLQAGGVGIMKKFSIIQIE